LASRFTKGGQPKGASVPSYHGEPVKRPNPKKGLREWMEEQRLQREAAEASRDSWRRSY